MTSYRKLLYLSILICLSLENIQTHENVDWLQVIDYEINRLEMIKQQKEQELKQQQEQEKLLFRKKTSWDFDEQEFNEENFNPWGGK